ncbi:MAG: hypothetical protein JO262_14145 [Solirubrobacterales bacterium]|nr:hypothetical protein [Solirubrobacterales bacterium]MBV9943262.1 hypothetical protein [Solirubrobacterales bacterium]
MIAGFLLLVGIIGGVASGGIFTLIFVPLGLVMLVVAAGAGVFGRSSQDESDGDRQPSNTEPAPLRHTPAQGTPTPATPEDLADARRVQQ